MANSKNWGGYRVGAGRKPHPHRTGEVAQRLINRARDMNAPTPLDKLWRWCMDDDLVLDVFEGDRKAAIQFQRDTAISLAPFLFPKMQSITVSNPDDNKLVIVFGKADEAQVITGTTDPDLLAAADAVLLPSATTIPASLLYDDEDEDDL